jgi:hypothetical protein
MIKVQASALWKMPQNRESEHDLRRLGNRIDANQKTLKKKRATPGKASTIESRLHVAVLGLEKMVDDA